MNVNNEVSGARPEEENNNNIVPQSDVINFNESFSILKHLPLCNQLYQWLMVSDVKTHHVASLTSLFTIVSAVTARGYYSHTYASSSLFLIMIGKTGIGKNTVVKMPNMIMERLGLKHKILAGKIHSEGAMDDIFKDQNVAVQVVDEFGDFLGHMLNDKGGYFKAIAAKMKNLYSLTNSIYEPSRYSSTGGKNRTDDPWHTTKPCFGITGLTTETQLLRHLNADQISDGFLNRFIIFNGQNIEPQFNDHPTYDIPVDIMKHIKSIQMATGYTDQTSKGDAVIMAGSLQPNEPVKYFTSDECTVIPLSEEAMSFYKNFIGDADIKDTDIYHFCLNDESEIKREISIRWRENTLRLAIALTAFEKQNKVSLAVLQWCYTLVKGSSIDFLQLFQEKASQTQYEELKQKGLDWFRSQNNKTQYHTLSELARNARPFSTMKSKERKELLDDLVESGLIESKIETGINNGSITSYRLLTN